MFQLFILMGTLGITGFVSTTVYFASGFQYSQHHPYENCVIVDGRVAFKGYPYPENDAADVSFFDKNESLDFKTKVKMKASTLIPTTCPARLAKG
ncbi:hypothetical protein OIU34_21595 [Pararhizobium sp. BT-229]|uniref:hypothetical protein n=1 Tax=Pararhizobium sp. BT-229 TaxID=2986923 RepID=UPI0021F7DFDB|nr:hypothetical protein [Pararhizobium sp. BT-229]MCV9964488.1 hypothetical protein [Pararhizobium sp. BT-229]